VGLGHKQNLSNKFDFKTVFWGKGAGRQTEENEAYNYSLKA